MYLGHENVSKAFVPTNYYKVDRTNWVPPTGSMKCVLCLENKCMHADCRMKQDNIRGVVLYDFKLLVWNFPLKTYEIKLNLDEGDCGYFCLQILQ